MNSPTQTAIYIISAITPESGVVQFETPYFDKAHAIHQNLMMRQLDPNDMTCDVLVRTIWRDN